MRLHNLIRDLQGKHLRHARDHYTLLLDALESPPPRVVNYDVRLRNTPMESSKVAAKEAIKDTLGRLEKLVHNPALVDERLTLHAVTPHPQVFETTFGREVSASAGFPDCAKSSALDVIPSYTHVSVHLAVVL